MTEPEKVYGDAYGERLREGAAIASSNLASECEGWDRPPSRRMTKGEQREFMASIARHLRFVADLLRRAP